MQFLIVFGAILLHCSAQDLIVDLPDGKVEGTTFKTSNGREMYAWRGIPYAKPPLGELRFKAPVKPVPWKGVLDARNDAKSCLFVGSYPVDPKPTHGNSEDCLYVNVYTPVKPNLKNASLPVMFWIYGGGYFTGSSDFAFFDPTPFLLEDVIFVSFNYRLSLFGFLSTEDELVPGNSGLKDQLAALVWTKENIARFGGNPMDITIFGESAGAISVGYHIVSPKSKNLFSAAIMESGTGLLAMNQKNPKNVTVTLAKLINSKITNSSSTKEVLKDLHSASADLLVNLSLANSLSFWPIMEVNTPSAFLPISIPLYEAIEAGNITKVPIIIGTNSAEYLGMMPGIEYAKLIAAEDDEDTTPLLPNMNLKEGVKVKTVTDKIKQAYVGNGNFTDNFGQFVNWESDNVFGRAAIKHAQLQSQFTKVFFYQFSFAGTSSNKYPIIPGCGRVGHAEELPYLFNISTKHITTEAEFLTRSRFVKLWTNFAKTKNPTPKDSSAELLQNVQWEPFDPKKLQYIDIGNDLVVKTNLKGNLTDFWTGLWDTYATRPYNTY